MSALPPTIDCTPLPAEHLGVPDGWQLRRPQPTQGDGPPAPPARLYAVVGSWHEGDVIAACVRHLFQQGCDEVHLVDNDSPDDTLEQATHAGAVVADVYRTPQYCEATRLLRMNAVARRLVETAAAPRAWVLSLDADEFPFAPGGVSLKDFLDQLPLTQRCVGAHNIDLYPAPGEDYRVGVHPAACFSLGVLRRSNFPVFCDHGHWKHPALAFDNGVFDLAQARGSHEPFAEPGSPAGALVLEPDEGIVILHAPLRGREATRQRLTALCGPPAGGPHRSALDDVYTEGHGAVRRWRALEAVYAGRWDEVEMPHAQALPGELGRVQPQPWRRLVSAPMETLTPDAPRNLPA